MLFYKNDHLTFAAKYEIDTTMEMSLTCITTTNGLSLVNGVLDVTIAFSFNFQINHGKTRECEQ
jgi:hypothetical protein